VDGSRILEKALLEDLDLLVDCTNLRLVSAIPK